VRRGTVAQADGTAIAYDVVGDGPPVVFLHGLTNRRQAWDPVTALLAERFACVRVDFRGHGESSAAPAYGMPWFVGDVRAVVEELALQDPTLVGHSLGASVAAVYAAVHDARAVVCVDESLRFGDIAERIQRFAANVRWRR
jgi:pimeloyl-ACP methyl ester carboxylesterase